MGEAADNAFEYFAEQDHIRITQEAYRHKPRTKTQLGNKYARFGGSLSLATFSENLGPWLTMESVKQFSTCVQAKFSSTKEKLLIAGDIKALARQLGCISVNVYNDATIRDKLWVNVMFPFEADFSKETPPLSKTPSKKDKKMNEDFEFYLALLQSSGVKMVEVSLDTRSYHYLCAIDVTVDDNVTVQARNMLMVGTIIEVLEEWNMDIVEQFGEDLKWVISKVDISNVKLYADQKKQVFEQLRQSRLVEKAKKFAGASNLNFDSLVRQTQDRLAIAHDDGVVGE